MREDVVHNDSDEEEESGDLSLTISFYRISNEEMEMEYGEMICLYIQKAKVVMKLRF